MGPAELARLMRGNGWVHAEGSRRPARSQRSRKSLTLVDMFHPECGRRPCYSTHDYVDIVSRNSFMSRRSMRSTPVALVAEAGRMMRSLLNDLLDMSQIESGHIEAGRMDIERIEFSTSAPPSSRRCGLRAQSRAAGPFDISLLSTSSRSRRRRRRRRYPGQDGAGPVSRLRCSGT
jgi:signal transduction histidine kinase